MFLNAINKKIAAATITTPQCAEKKKPRDVRVKRFPTVGGGWMAGGLTCCLSQLMSIGDKQQHCFSQKKKKIKHQRFPLEFSHLVPRLRRRRDPVNSNVATL